MENRQLAGKVCVVTGGALGIGRCLTHVFALQGADVAFIDLNAQAGAETERLLMQEGREPFFMRAMSQRRRSWKHLHGASRTALVGWIF